MPHIHELYDFVISVYIVNGDRVLMIDHPRYGKWLPIGGHIELDEDPEEALHREIAEETGLQVEILATKPSVESPDAKFVLTPNFVDVHEANLPHRHIAFVYFARSQSDQVVLSDEHLGFKWFSLEDAKDPQYGLSPANLFYIESALKAA